MQLEEVGRNPLTDRVIRRIQDHILRGDVAPGEYLPPQPQLAAQLGVGLSTVREALKALQLIGLVESTPGRGTMVMPNALKILSSDAAMKANLEAVDLQQALEARTVLEVALTRLAAERATAGDIVEIRAHLDEMHSSLGDAGAFVRADMRFHLAVARASKNSVLTQAYYFIQSLLEQVVQEADALPGGAERALVNHGEIVAGIINHQPDRAQTATERQMLDVVEYLRNGAITAQT
jgi:GntR family transcriptional repressor for pyruvate dehydrogenase complex